MGRANMRIEGPQWFYFEGDGETLRQITTTDRALATGTSWVATALHPKDKHEFGLMLTQSEVTETLDSRPQELLQDALDGYLNDHPKGASWRYHIKNKLNRWAVTHGWISGIRRLKRAGYRLLDP